MCGIAASFRLDGAPASPDAVSRMVARLGHRGPDGDDVFVDGPIALGHTRLRIIDLSEAGRQPLRNEDETLHLVYNGEIYNYRELRRELEAAGHRFRSQTDTEVLVHAYEQWGPDCLHRLNGMFAFALWDAPRRTLFCARDRLGVKPLVYAQHGDTLLLASEIKALVAALLATPPPDEEAIADYVALDYVDHSERTFFAGIRQLRPGHRLVAEGGGVRIEQWWRLPVDAEPDETIDDRSAVDAFRSLFDDAVKLRLRSDVPVGSCLSGGFDSTAVVCTVDELLRRHDEARAVGPVQRTFSAVFPDDPVDESRYIDAVGEATKTEQHRIAASGKALLEQARTVVRQQDEPFGSASIVAQWHVMELARRTGVTVLLDGQGGDELLAGYHAFVGYRVADLLSAGRVLEALRELRAFHAAQRQPWLLTARTAAVPFVPRALRTRLRMHDKRAATTLTPRLRRMAGERRSRPSARTRLAEERFHVYTRGLPALLRYEDRNSMAFSLEARLPFLDYRLVELSFRLPPRVLLRNGETKWLLREALHDRLPPAVRERRDKVGFATPQTRWLREAAHEVDALVAARDFGGGYLERAAVRRLVEQQRRRPGLDFAVWRCICLDLWLREVVEANRTSQRPARDRARAAA